MRTTIKVGEWPSQRFSVELDPWELSPKGRGTRLN
jgi:hypothetical protein